MQIRNVVTLIGNVGKEPQARTTQNGSPMLTFSFATKDVWRDQKNERQSRTDWHKIVVFGPKAEMMQKLVKKGSKLAITGSLRYNKWTDKDGQPRSIPQIHLDAFEFLTAKADAQTTA